MTRMELVLSAVAFASFLVLIASWVLVPHSGQSITQHESAHEAPAGQILTAN